MNSIVFRGILSGALMPAIKTLPIGGGGGDFPLTATPGEAYETSLSLGLTESADDLSYADCVVSLSQSRNVVQTAIAGRAGTVKEYINNGDWALNIKIGVPGDGRNYPEDGVRQLLRLLQSEQALYVDSDWLRAIGIRRIVVTDVSVEQQTHRNYQVVEVDAVSDDEYDIRTLVNES